MSEKELLEIQHTRKGRKLLFSNYYTYMLCIANRYLLNIQDAEDALSEAYIRIFKKLDSFQYKEEGSLRKWMKTIVINESLRIIKSRRSYEDDNILETWFNDDEEIDLPFNIADIVNIINELPEGYRIVFLMYCIEDYSHQQIANYLDISVSTSKSQLHKARKTIIAKTKEL